MSQEVTHDVECDQCNMSFELSYIDTEEDSELPMYCPFCGSDIDVEEESEDDLFLDDLDDDADWEDRL